MRIIALATLKAFFDAKPAHVDAREPTMAWYRQVKSADWANPADVKRDIRSVSILKDGRAEALVWLISWTAITHLSDHLLWAKSLGYL